MNILNRNQSYIFLVIYGMTTLYGRLYFEKIWMVSYMESMLIGLTLVAIPVVMVKLKMLKIS